MQCGVPQSYRILSYVNGLTSLSDTITLIPYDIIPPAQVDIVSASVTSGTSIALQFNKVTKKTTRKYLVYAKKDHGTFVLVDSVLAKNIVSTPYTYNYKINTLTDTFALEVFALDSCGNLSKTSENHRAMQLNGKALEDSASLKWSNYIGFSVKNYIVQTWAKASGWTDYKSLPSNDSIFSEPGHCTAQLYYRIKAIENGGANAVAFSDSVQVRPFDTIAPARDSMVSVSVINGSHISITFNKVADPDVIGLCDLSQQRPWGFCRN